MSTPFASAITTSKATLMHACLAHLSPEIQTIDDIIHNAPIVPAPSLVALPTEILLLVRESLFPLINTQLVQQSTTALETYEQSLRNLLCPDCIAYNLDIYGPNIWQWEQFTGACACVEIESPPGHRHSTTLGPRYRQGQRHHKTPAAPGTTFPNPKQFTNAQHWLESYLSNEAAIRVKRRGHSLPTPSASCDRSAPSPSVDIWDAVALVLQEFSCEAIREAEETKPLLSRGAFQYKLACVQVVPLRPFGSEIMTPLYSADATWPSQVVLHRAMRDLRLESAEPFGAHKRDTSSFKVRLWHPGASKSRGNIHQHLVQALLGIVGSLAAACLSLPFTFATLALTILCFYSRPRSFRII